jgi:MFS family permease
MVIAAYNYRAVFILAGSLMGVATALRLWLARRGRGQKTHAPSRRRVGFGEHLFGLAGILLAGGLLTWLFLLDGVLDAGASFSEKLQPIYLQSIGGLPVSTIGILTSLAGLAGVIAAWLSGRIGQRWGERAAMVLSLLAIATGWVTMLTSTTVLGFGAAIILLGFGNGMADPAWKSLISRAVPLTSLGMTYAAFESTAHFFSLPFPWIGAQLWERVSPRAPFIVTIFITLSAVLPVWLTFKVSPESPAEKNDGLDCCV